MARLTKVSVDNLKNCESVKIIIVDQKNNFGLKGHGYYVTWKNKEFMGWLHDAKGPMIYKTAQQARRAILRIRPDLETPIDDFP